MTDETEGAIVFMSTIIEKTELTPLLIEKRASTQRFEGQNIPPAKIRPPPCKSYNRIRRAKQPKKKSSNRKIYTAPVNGKSPPKAFHQMAKVRRRRPTKLQNLYSPTKWQKSAEGVPPNGKSPPKAFHQIATK